MCSHMQNLTWVSLTLVEPGLVCVVWTGLKILFWWNYRSTFYKLGVKTLTSRQQQNCTEVDQTLFLNVIGVNTYFYSSLTKKAKTNSCPFSFTSTRNFPCSIKSKKISATHEKHWKREKSISIFAKNSFQLSINIQTWT